VEFSSNLSTVYTKWCTQSFPPIFGLFTTSDRNFAKIMAPPCNENENYVVHQKEQSILKKALKTASKSTHKPSHNTCLNYVPHEQADQTGHTQNTNFRSYSRHA